VFIKEQVFVINGFHVALLIVMLFLGACSIINLKLKKRAVPFTRENAA
jgi:hypothetical protein